MATREENISTTVDMAMKVWESRLEELAQAKENTVQRARRTLGEKLEGARVGSSDENIIRKASKAAGKFLTEGGRFARQDRQTELNKRRKRLTTNISNPFYEGVIMSTTARLDMCSARDAWPGVDALKALPGVTVVCEADGRVEVFYKGEQTTIYVSDDLKSAGREDARFDERFGIKQVLGANPLFEGMDDERRKRVIETAKAGAIIWAMAILSAKNNDNGMTHETRSGLKNWKKTGVSIETQFVSDLRDVGETGSMVYSSDPELDNLIGDDFVVDDARDAMAAGAISMHIQEGKITIFDGGEEKIAYTSDDGIVLFNDADGNLVQTSGHISIPDKIFKRMEAVRARSGKTKFSELYEMT